MYDLNYIKSMYIHIKTQKCKILINSGEDQGDRLTISYRICTSISFSVKRYKYITH